MRFKNLLLTFFGFVFLPAITWGQVVDVTIGDNFFSPKNLTVQRGTTVRWTHVGFFLHTTTADDGTWNSGTLSNGQSFQFTFNQVGTYPYYCAFHGAPGGFGQSGTIQVQGKAVPLLGWPGVGLLLAGITGVGCWLLRKRTKMT